MDKTWRVLLAFVGIFLAGTVCGGLVAIRAVKAPLGEPHRPPPKPEEFGPQLLKRFADKLDLTREQREAIKPIVGRAAEDLRHQRREVLLSSKTIIERMQDEMSAVMTPDQRVKFTALIDQQRAKVRKYLLEDQPLRPRRAENQNPK